MKLANTGGLCHYCNQFICWFSVDRSQIYFGFSNGGWSQVIHKDCLEKNMGKFEYRYNLAVFFPTGELVGFSGFSNESEKEAQENSMKAMHRHKKWWEHKSFQVVNPEELDQDQLSKVQADWLLFVP